MGKWRNQVRKAHTAVVMKVWEAKTKLAETSGEGYVDTAVKILIAVVLGALLLAGLYALFNDTVLPTLDVYKRQVLASELKHCILAHHGEYEYGSPKKPALMEAMALNLADNADAKLETFTEILEGTSETGWLGYNRLFESNLRMTRMD